MGVLGTNFVNKSDTVFPRLQMEWVVGVGMASEKKLSESPVEVAAGQSAASCRPKEPYKDSPPRIDSVSASMIGLANPRDCSPNT